MSKPTYAELEAALRALVNPSNFEISGRNGNTICSACRAELWLDELHGDNCDLLAAQALLARIDASEAERYRDKDRDGPRLTPV